MAKERTLAETLDQQNRLARPTAKLLTERVVVLVSSVYNGAGHKALPLAKEGDVIDVAGGAYAESLVRDGLVTRYVEPSEPETQEAAVEPDVDVEAVVDTPKPRRKRTKEAAD